MPPLSPQILVRPPSHADGGGRRQRVVITGPTMGTQFSAAFYAGPGMPMGPLGDALQVAVNRVDQQMSTWKPGSELSRFNRAPQHTWFNVPPEFAAVVACGLAIAARTDGAFDMGLGRIVDGWGFGPGGDRAAPPDEAEIAALAQSREPLGLELRPSPPAIRKTGNAALDLSAIAKGFGVDQLAAVLDARGLTDYVVSIDGEVRCRGQKPDGKPWCIAVEQPVPGERRVQRVLSLGTMAAATSGNYRKFHVAESGARLAHTIDARTGRPVHNRIASVTVLNSTCMEADGLATALLAMGETAGPAFANRHGIPALFLVDAGARIAEQPVAGFDALTTPHI